MKGLLVVALLALAAGVFGADEPNFTYLPPKYPCTFTVDVDSTTLLTHNTYKFYVHGEFMRFAHYSHSNVLMEDTIYRPDINYYDNVTNKTFFQVFGYSSDGCTNTSQDIEPYEKDPMEFFFADKGPVLDLFVHNHTFFNKTSTTFNGQECSVYFDLDIDHLAYYVDSENRIIGIVTDRDIPDQRTTLKLKWGDYAAHSDFTFKKSFVYNCTYQGIFEDPNKTKCAASSIQVFAALILASLVLSLIALF